MTRGPQPPGPRNPAEVLNIRHRSLSKAPLLPLSKSTICPRYTCTVEPLCPDVNRKVQVLVWFNQLTPYRRGLCCVLMKKYLLSR